MAHIVIKYRVLRTTNGIMKKWKT